MSAVRRKVSNLILNINLYMEDAHGKKRGNPVAEGVASLVPPLGFA
jgi:hypothetical protein